MSEHTEICGVVSCSVNEVPCVINRMTIDIYNQLCSEDKIDKSQIYMIDDPECFDVQNKRIIRVADPVDSTDAVNYEVLTSDYSSNDELSSTLYIKDAKVDKIITLDRKNCISSDGNLYEKDMSDSAWTINVISSVSGYTDDQMSVYYRYEPPLGFTIRVTRNDTTIIDFCTNELCTEAMFIQQETLSSITEGQPTEIITVELYRNTWNKTDGIISKNKIKNCLSSLCSDIDEDTIENIYNCLSSIKQLCEL